MKHILLFCSLVFILTSCSQKELEPIVYTKLDKHIDYELDIKPILNKRCVVCHSCYNSPCQLKFSSYEGLSRGASKQIIYNSRLSSIEPSRLFIDAKSTKQWREKGFFSVTKSLDKDENNSLMMYFLNQKMKYKKSKGSYAPNTDELTCSQDKSDLREYFNDNPHKGMPYGMPALQEDEYNKIATWLNLGAKREVKKDELLQSQRNTINKWETFFNKSNIKNQVTSRYIYEHLYLAHIKFDTIENKFFEIVRSTTPSNTLIDVIATRFVYSKPENEKFFYRLQEVNGTLVKKTHMTYIFNDKKMQRFKELFIKPTWVQKPHLISYDLRIAANGIKTFEQIPADSRYKFLLDNNHFFIKTFIRGPVCKGQIALNVIDDQFWVNFIDPKYDLALKDNSFLSDNLNNLVIPNDLGSNVSLFKIFKTNEYSNKSIIYYQNRNKIYNKYYQDGLPLKAIWKGNQKPQNDATLTIYRHFNSASVHKGALGNTPKTQWIIDYALFERIYYSLVAGYDIFGNSTHGVLIRRYMNRLRIEGESNFLEFLPQKQRLKTHNLWYQGWWAKKFSTYIPSETKSSIKYKSKDYKKELSLKLLEHTKTIKDKINFLRKDFNDFSLPLIYKDKEDLEKAFKVLSIKSKLKEKVTNYSANLAYIKITLNKQTYVYTLIVNRWHDNVAFLFNEYNRLDSSKDSLNFIEGFLGSYPNYFFEVKEDEISDFMDMFLNYEDNDKYNFKLAKYGINRANTKFWKTYDWFQKNYNQSNKDEASLFDLNRYYEKAENLGD